MLAFLMFAFPEELKDTSTFSGLLGELRNISNKVPSCNRAGVNFINTLHARKLFVRISI